MSSSPGAIGPAARAWFNLVRVPNLVTAGADVLAGFLFSGGKLDEWFIVLRLALASVCLYAAGVTLNDVCDAHQDAQERPSRPIPCGEIDRTKACRFGFGLLLAGVLLAATVTVQSFLVGCALASLILLYNLLKPTALAAPLMGLCRAFNLLLGMHGLTGIVPLPALRPMGIMGLYVTSLTFFARKEAHAPSRLRLAAGLFGLSAAIIFLWQLRWYGDNSRYDQYGYLAAVMLLGVCIIGLSAVLRPSAARIQRGVKSFVLGIIVLDACFAWVAAGPVAAAAVASLLIPCIMLARVYRVT